MSDKIDNRRDVLLLFLYSPGISDECNEPIKGRTRLEKLMFVFKKEGLNQFKKGTSLDEENYYKFFAWNFGPFSTQVYDDLNFFHLRGFIDYSEPLSDGRDISAQEQENWEKNVGIEYDNDEYTSDYVDYETSLSPKGLIYTKKIYYSLTDSQKSLLRSFKKKFNQTNLRSIIRYVYKEYPDYTDKSIIADDILRR